jgi:hypothetical protein
VMTEARVRLYGFAAGPSNVKREDAMNVGKGVWVGEPVRDAAPLNDADTVRETEAGIADEEAGSADDEAGKADEDADPDNETEALKEGAALEVATSALEALAVTEGARLDETETEAWLATGKGDTASIYIHK